MVEGGRGHLAFRNHPRAQAQGAVQPRPCRVGGTLPDPGTGDPLGLVHGGACMGQPPNVLHGQDEVPG
jgi:hypothetical protein